MATPRQYQDYPLEYTELFKRAFHNPIRVPFPTEIQAKRFRNHLYAFRTSIRDSVEEDNVPDHLVVIAPLISFHIEGSAVNVHRPKRIDNITKALEAAGK